jgi:hypothetical protein
MQNRSDAQLRFLLCGILLLSALAGGPRLARGADNCPTAADEIATDRPDVTNSSLVVPLGSLQAENGIDWTVGHGSNVLDGTNTRLRLGVAHCTEFLIDISQLLRFSERIPALGLFQCGGVLQTAASRPIWFRPVGDGWCRLSLRLQQNLGARLSAIHTVPVVPPHRRELGRRRHVHSHLVP